MKITIETQSPDLEDEIIIRCAETDEEIMELIYLIKSRRKSLTGFAENGMVKLSPKDIFYFEAVDNHVFAYRESSVYEVKLKLYEIEEMYPHSDFLRISKSVIANVSKISLISRAFGAKLEAKLKNGEKIIISRQYVPELKRKLGLEEGGK